MSRLLIVSHDLIGERMAGVGIRYYEVARALAQDRDLQVALAAPLGSSLPSETPPGRVQFFTYDPANLSTLDAAIAGCDVMLAYPDTVWQHRAALDRHNKAVVVDGYDITLFEHLEVDPTHSGLDERLRWHAEYQRMMQYVLERGDFFVAATERQRDWWLGALAMAGRINPLTYQADPSLRQFVDLLPYGLPEREPVHTRPVMRGVIEGIGANDKIVLWGGGAWEWLDPLTLVRAAGEITRKRSDVKFVFPGLRHPAGTLGAQMPIQQRTVELARELNLLDRTVFVGDWVPYEDWQNYLLESDIGISLHRDHLEARFSARTRVLSYIWAGLPMVLTRGDELAERMAQAGAAILVEEDTPAAVATAILDLLDRPRNHEHVAWDTLRHSMSWQAAVQALRRFCKQPARAPDAMQLLAKSNDPGAGPASDSQPSKHTETTERTSAAGMSQTTTNSSQQTFPEPPDLLLPSPSGLLTRLLAPLLDKLVFWRLRTMIWQQNQINRSLWQNWVVTHQHFGRVAADLAAQQQHAQAMIADLAAQQQHAQAMIADLAAQQEYHLRVVQTDLQQLQVAHDRHEHRLEGLRKEIADAEHLQTDLIAEFAKRLCDEA
ncbi:MAG: glycosyltransferase family 4 protein [Anaerolineae bacterium]|nr:glycosyltransferase family 4 protein [Thermoflexales bacterium]MDW8406849.1 glycosyltransferase family 4 protein [Anaerolineae bacterium]